MYLYSLYAYVVGHDLYTHDVAVVPHVVRIYVDVFAIEGANGEVIVVALVENKSHICKKTNKKYSIYSLSRS